MLPHYPQQFDKHWTGSSLSRL